MAARLSLDQLIRERMLLGKSLRDGVGLESHIAVHYVWCWFGIANLFFYLLEYPRRRTPEGSTHWRRLCTAVINGSVLVPRFLRTSPTGSRVPMGTKRVGCWSREATN